MSEFSIPVMAMPPALLSHRVRTLPLYIHLLG